MALKRKIFGLFSILICLFAVLGLTSCGGSGTKLSEPEQLLLDAFTENVLLDFKNPSSVKFLKVSWAKCDGAIVKFTVSAQNGFGGTTNNEFELVVKNIPDTKKYYTSVMESFESITSFATSLSKGSYITLDDLSVLPINELDKTGRTIYYLSTSNATNGSEYNIGNLNAGLEEYKVSQGW